jgi:hypothetical protein
MTTRTLIVSLFLVSSLWSQPLAGGQETPFKGTIQGTQTITPLAPPFIFVEFTGSGNATQLGRFSLTIPHTVNQPAGTGVGSYAFIAANGDILTADFLGTASLIEPGLVAIVETAVITGGTGRFAGATGTFRVERTFSFITSVSVGSFEGTITLAK